MITNVDSTGYPTLCQIAAACSLVNSCTLNYSCTLANSFTFPQPTHCNSFYHLNSKIHFDDIREAIRFAKLDNTSIDLTEEEVEKYLDEDPTIFDDVKLNIV